MTPVATLALVLFIVGVLLLFAQSVIAAVGPVAPGWVGAGLIAVAYSLTKTVG